MLSFALRVIYTNFFYISVVDWFQVCCCCLPLGPVSTQNSCEYSDSRGGGAHHHVRSVQELSRDRQQRSAADRGDTQNLYLPLTVMQVKLETNQQTIQVTLIQPRQLMPFLVQCGISNKSDQSRGQFDIQSQQRKNSTRLITPAEQIYSGDLSNSESLT